MVSGEEGRREFTTRDPATRHSPFVNAVGDNDGGQPQFGH
jgi:hypothetical protein